jgi:hypothetical protein
LNELQNIIADLEQQRTAIETAINALRGVNAGAATPAASINDDGMSEGRRRQAEAMRQYWANRKAAKSAPEKKAAAKGGISAEGRKRLSEMMRKRWAAKRKAERNS